MELKKVDEYTKDELLQLENFGEKEKFSSIVIVPTGNLHDSEFECMKFILCNGFDIVGVVSGWSDVVHVDGIGGYGLNYKETLKTGMTKICGWCIDCLPKSGCVRLFSNYACQCAPFIGSDFQFYTLTQE